MRKKARKITFLEKINTIKWDLPLHPFLFAVYPILFIYAGNLDEIFLVEILVPGLISLSTTLVVFFIFKFIFKDTHKAAFLTTLALIIFFTYGHIFTLIEGDKIFGFQVGRNKFLLPFSTVLFTLAFLSIYKLRNIPTNISNTLNLIASFLILISLLPIGNYAYTNGLQITESTDKKTETIKKTSEKSLPDIYYIILDGYAREDTLKVVHNYDNSDFINYLKDKGFYVASKSQSNYSLTLLSLSSSLNMKYLTDLTNEEIEESKKREKGIELIRNNEVARFLKSKGYAFINIGTGWGATDKNPYADEVFHYRQRSEFTKILYQTTLLVAVERFQLGDADSILFAFEKLKEIPSDERPTFSFAHIVSPHPPYLFDRDGNKLKTYNKAFDSPEAWEQRDKYISQLIFINKKTKELVEAILSKSDNPPIIIIQGDHGTGSLGSTPLDKVSLDKLNERMENLNAYYLPNGGSKTLYSTITPVNTFRKIFNFYFGTDYKILEDVSYYSQYRKYFDFIVAPAEKK